MALTPLGGAESVMAQKSIGAAAKVFGDNIVVVMQDTGKALIYDMAGNVLGEAVDVGFDMLKAPKVGIDEKIVVHDTEFDFQKDNIVVSLNTIDPRLPSYQGNKLTAKIRNYMDDLDVDITVDDISVKIEEF